jgi:hypothetical protein
MGYSLDGQDTVAVAGNTTLAGLPAGAHNITVYAKDAAGNIGASDTVYFSKETDLLPIVLVIAVSAAVVGIGLLIYFKKRRH